MILFSICDIPWWLLWLLPFLLGALLWWLGNNKYKSMVAEYDGKIKSLNGIISGLEDDLAACKSKRSDLEGDLALTKGRMREMEADMKSLKASGSSSGAAADNNTSAEYEGKIKKLNGTISGLESDLAACKSKRSDLEGDLAATKGKMKEMEADLKASKASNDSGASHAASAALGAVASSLTGSGDKSESASLSATPISEEKPKGATSTAAKSIFGGIKSDNLQIIEGIGPKMESVLKENGIDNHKTLGSKSLDDLKGILSKYGDKYKIIDPKSWPSQAQLAGNGDFDGLILLQKKLDAGKENASGMTDSKLEKYLIKTGALKAFKQDDLKAIEGIGPATDKLLRENGINTWRELANTSADSIKAILTAAGSRFALGDPTTWPKQAELAADGKFDELREYQDFLDGGKA